MKTIVTCNKTEAADLLKKFLNYADDVHIIDETPALGAEMNIIEAIYRVTRIDFPNTYLTNQKIAAIKRLREYMPSLTLSDAKYIVENPESSCVTWCRSKPMGTMTK